MRFNSNFQKLVFIIISFTLTFANSEGRIFEQAIDSGTEESDTAGYFAAETREAVQAISYGFTSWYEDENKLPGGLITLVPTGDEEGINDRANIQNAVDSMSKAGGGKVLLKAGKYYVNNQVMMKSNVILRGEGMDKTVIRNTRTAGDGASWNAVMIGLHHPAFVTRGREDVYHKVKFGPVEAGSNTFTILDGIFDCPVFTNQDNRKTWDDHKPAVGEMLMIMDYYHGRDGGGNPIPATHHWTQFAKITKIDGYTVTLDEPHVMGKEFGVACWIPSPAPFNNRANLSCWWAENCVVGDMEFENTAGLIYAYMGVRNCLVENIKAVNMRGEKRGLQIQGFYKSTVQGCYVEYEGGRSIEIKHGSGRCLIRNNKFVNIGALSSRPAVSLGESVYAIHIQDNEWHYQVSPHTDTWTFFMPQQYGGSFKRNYIHGDPGVAFPNNASMFQIKGGASTYTYLSFNYPFYRNTGYMVWENNRYDIQIGKTYDFFTEGMDHTDKYWMRGALIKDEDWTGSVIIQPEASRIRNGFPSRPEDVVIVENIINMKGSSISWLAEAPAKCYPRTFADINDPARMNSVITSASLSTNTLINDTLVRAHGMVVKIGNTRYLWNEPAKRWENQDGGDHVYYVGDTTGVKITIRNDVIIYPNPFSNVLHIEFLKNLIPGINFDIVDISGKVVTSGIIENDRIHVNNLEKGFYILQIEGNQFKILKQ